MGGFFDIHGLTSFIFVHGLNGLIACYAAGFGFPEDICTLAP